MGGGTVKFQSSYSEVFDNMCPYYMSMGMSYQEYWYEDPFIVRFYYEADIFRRRKRNEELWIAGMYFARAIGANFDKRAKYPDKPFDIFPKTAMEKQAEAEEQRRKIIEHFSIIKQNWENKNGNNRQLNS